MTEIIKKNQAEILELKSIMMEMKMSQEGLNYRVKVAEERIEYS